MSLDLSRINFDETFFKKMEAHLEKAFTDMRALEAGAIANPDEGRMVGHYWLRNPDLAPTPEIRQEIETTLAHVQAFANEVHTGAVSGTNGPFKNFLLIGIGGSALGPQFVAHALGHPVTDKLHPHFFDNTDPDGMHRVLAMLAGDLGKTLCLVISKSGGTKETRNGMLEAKAAYEAAGLDFGKHTVAVTQEGSALDDYSTANGWLRRFPMWDWVGGRTSQMSVVGLLPAALQGFNITKILAGAKACDQVTKAPHLATNPAAQLAAAWFQIGGGKGKKCMVVLPYRDRLELLSRYLQQLVMESLGKEFDLVGNLVHQGITVFGNKGSTDQHSYVQQLRDGLDNSFVLFINVLTDHLHTPLSVENQATSADFLNGFYLGTRQALSERGRESISITLQEVSPFSVGALIALFERAVGYYASLIGINAYHQPGVEAGKKAAASILDLQRRILKCLANAHGAPLTVKEISMAAEATADIEHVFRICEHLNASQGSGVIKLPANSWLESAYLKP
ncbi:MAG: glucose-6-phosphate isomerase [Verrucomicrobia bacterium]|nr:glucose-6-phosphate isomerase [Verrucomicrobiota bacterium]